MTELEKALYADVCWLKKKLEQQREATKADAHASARAEVLGAALEISGVLGKYLNRR